MIGHCELERTSSAALDEKLHRRIGSGRIRGIEGVAQQALQHAEERPVGNENSRVLRGLKLQASGLSSAQFGAQLRDQVGNK